MGGTSKVFLSLVILQFKAICDYPRTSGCYFLVTLYNTVQIELRAFSPINYGGLFEDKSMGGFVNA